MKQISNLMLGKQNAARCPTGELIAVTVQLMSKSRYYQDQKHRLRIKNSIKFGLFFNSVYFV